MKLRRIYAASSLVQGCTASVLPVYSKFFYEQWAKGTVPIAPPYIRDNLWFYVENKTMDQKKVVRAISTIQQWIDTGISKDYTESFRIINSYAASFVGGGSSLKVICGHSSQITASLL